MRNSIIFLFFLLAFFISGCQNYENHLSSDRRNFLDNNLTFQDKKYILTAAFNNDASWRISRYVDQNLTKSFCKNNFKVNEIYTPNEVVNALNNYILSTSPDKIKQFRYYLFDQIYEKTQLNALDIFNIFRTEFYVIALIICILFLALIYIVFKYLHQKYIEQKKVIEQKNIELNEIKTIKKQLNDKLDHYNMQIKSLDKLDSIKNKISERNKELNCLTSSISIAESRLKEINSEINKRIKDAQNNFNIKCKAKENILIDKERSLNNKQKKFDEAKSIFGKKAKRAYKAFLEFNKHHEEEDLKLLEKHLQFFIEKFEKSEFYRKK